MAEVVVSKVADEVAGSLLTKIKKHINYMRKCKDNVVKLRSEFEMLKNLKEGVEEKIKLALEDGNGLLPGVEIWVKDAVDHISTTGIFLQEAEKFLNHGEQSANNVSKKEEYHKKEAAAKKTCFNLNILHRYDYGKEAINKADSLDTHRTNWAAFEGNVSVTTRAPGNIELTQRKNIDELPAHKSVLSKIIESVTDESTQITGIWGIGGVGKTTLANEVAAKLKGDGEPFSHVEFVIVSQRVDAEKIREDVKAAAKRIMKGEKVLIILDDLWRELKLEDVGIPCGSERPNCKILLTSRKSRVCEAMNAKKTICVDSLPIKEAWILFKGVVGERVETDAKLKTVATKVVEGCGGLPLILQAVGNSLKDEENFKEWVNARDNIKKHRTSDIDPAIRSEFAHLRLSYDYLESEEAKSIFLLCSMFPEDFDIPLELLAYYGVGLQVFGDISLADARNKVEGAVKILKSSCLLLNGNNKSTTKMHDVVREVALLIASKGDNKLLIEAGKNLTEWEPRIGSLESYTGISIMENKIREFPAGYQLNIPLLKIFLMQGNRKLWEITDEFTYAMKEATVIDLENNNIWSLPKSFNQLTRLRMLNLRGNRNIHDVSILGELKQLEILILNDIFIREIPPEIGKLVNLRMLLAQNCRRLSHIAPGALSKLRWLEELHIMYYPREEWKDNSLVEIGKLSKLKRLKTFSIRIGDHFSTQGKRALILGAPEAVDISDLMHVRKLIEICHGICLVSIEKLENIMPMMCSEGFGLQSIKIQRCANLSCLVDVRVKENTRFLSEVEQLSLSDLLNLKLIWNFPDQYISLHNLVTCEITDCPKLEKLFGVSVAQGLVNMQNLKILRCRSLREVISDGDEETITDMVVPAKNIVFPRLAEIKLRFMSNLTSFYPGQATIKYPSLVNVNIADCYKMEKWGYGTYDTPKLQFVRINDTEVNGSTIDEALAKYKESQPEGHFPMILPRASISPAPAPTSSE